MNTDILIIGSGIAGLSLALKLAQHYRVTVLAKSSLNEGSSQYAQGGIAAVLDPFDSVDAHVQDTLIAGAGLCEEPAVRFVAEHAHQAIQELIQMGVPFSPALQPDSSFPFHLTQEGGHSYRRIIHAADHTGQSVIDTLIQTVHNTPNITLLPNHMTVDLLLDRQRQECIGAYVLDKAAGQIFPLKAAVTVLATGGASKAYLYTSNPDTSTGDGIAMAWRAGCRVGNMEFNQFHPTCLYHPQDRSFLISEAVRGEGGRLVLANGEAFMHKYHPDGELAPRDVVARAIDQEMKTRGIDCVYLDISHKPAAFLQNHFPTIYQRCLKVGIDMTQQPIPVVPAAHYTCGGVVTNLQGQTDLARLYAIGETAYTGLHGANRLASNSLLEGLVFAEAARQDILSKPLTQPLKNPKPWDTSKVSRAKERILVSHDWDEVRRVMWDYVGIVRTNSRLARALSRINTLEAEVEEFYRHHLLDVDTLELRNLTLVAKLMVRSAQARQESRGLHYNLDYPDMLADSHATILSPLAS
ncbi:L-aspartate oxidase [Thiomicrospira aerophila AL3]|uniref:L-aspartate oxidase n=1 Tax=Thiomicrospira aerophila AL3 TaxID=717772 RepID=W0DW79_9GAMM|nr:L-aspartate oxidase [Thiomicrospira aerophila]AHF01136.1 L-aspartate oxidase [Thiomicrospira aerophila AL3]